MLEGPLPTLFGDIPRYVLRPRDRPRREQDAVRAVFCSSTTITPPCALPRRSRSPHCSRSALPIRRSQPVTVLLSFQLEPDTLGVRSMRRGVCLSVGTPDAEQHCVGRSIKVELRVEAA